MSCEEHKRRLKTRTEDRELLDCIHSSSEFCRVSRLYCLGILGYEIGRCSLIAKLTQDKRRFSSHRSEDQDTRGEHL